jgi:hypothetical protein
MKKLLFIIAIFWLLVSNSSAWNPMTVGGKAAAGAACSTPDNGDVLDEGFVGAGYESSMADNEGAPDEDANLPGSPPANSCSEGLQTNPTDAAITSEWDNGSAIDSDTNDVDIVCEMYIDAVAIGDNNTANNILNWDDDTTEWSFGSGIAELVRRDPNYTIRAQGLDASSEHTIDLDTWLTVTIHLDQDDTTGDSCATTEESYIQVTGGTDTSCDGVAECTFCRTDAVDSRYLRIGFRGGVGDSADIYWGYCYVNTP